MSNLMYCIFSDKCLQCILGQLGGEQAIEVASERNPCIGKTTVFQEPEEFWLCKSKEKFGKLEVVVSTKPVKTFQVAA